ncbi:Sacsin [Leucoagaricus sp. SymC.cos]|nr:Sacsin [Leucoagaricus sp. SymC.cos]
MAEGFGETVAPTAAIKSILQSYPFSIGLLREILQNSDDARAKKQVFILDRRTHGSSLVYHPCLAETQGAALLAYNDALINNEDWKALQNIHQSSKTTDTSKIGKYGIGFRSCYHITDTPQILSDKYLAILDPQHEFAEVAGIKIGGVRLDIKQDKDKYRDHLSAFESINCSSTFTIPFKGSIFRLPLRKAQSQIGNRAISPDEISDLLNNFVRDELNVALLFLRNVVSVEIYEISVDGEKTKIASATIHCDSRTAHGDHKIRKARIQTHLSVSLEERGWRIIHARFSGTKADEALSQRLGGSTAATLKQHKLMPMVDLAIPLNWSDSTKIGRLFTFLPLPLKTEFPLHINAPFSLTPSRQNLRNGGEVGIVNHSDDRALIEWNKLLFDTYIPQAWATLLEVLVQHDPVSDIFNAWPTPQADIQSGDHFYWKNIVMNVTKCAIDLPIWPAFGHSSPSYNTSGAFLVADTDTSDRILRILSQTGVQITQPPQYVTRAMINNISTKPRVLSPQLAYRELRNLIHAVKDLEHADAQTIFGYLTSTLDCNYIAGLPLIPSVAGSRVSLETKASVSTFRTLLADDDEELFSAYDADAVSLKRLTPEARDLLLTEGVNVLNVKKLDPSRVLSYLKSSLYTSQHRATPSNDQVEWLNRFWRRVNHSRWDAQLFNSIYLVPTTQGLQLPTDTIFDTEAEPDVAGLLEMLGVFVLHPLADVQVRASLRHLVPSSNIHALLRALPDPLNVNLTEEQAVQISSYLISHLPSSSHRHGHIPSDPTLCSRLRSIPIFPIISPSPDNTITTRTYISSSGTVRGIDPDSVPVLPLVPATSWIDLRAISQDILQYLDPKYPSLTSSNVMQELVLEHFHSQRPGTHLAFVQYLFTNHLSVPHGTLTRLASIEFVLACDGKKRAPKDLVDPQARVAELYPGASPFLPDTSQFTREIMVKLLRELHLFISDISLDIVRERIRFISDGHASEELARTLINFIGESRLDCRRLFESMISFDMKWIPTSTGLESPYTCRDVSSHYGKTELFDEVMPFVRDGVRISLDLRKLFSWDVQVPFLILFRQLDKVINQAKPPFEKIRALVMEVGHRKLKESEIYQLRVLLVDKRWIPTREETLVSVPFALLAGEDAPDVGFHSVVFDSSVTSFLRRMGCVDRPSKETILSCLKSLQTLPAAGQSNNRATQALGVIHLLRWLPPLTSSERADLVIPDTDEKLRTFDQIYFNDIGPRAYLVDRGASFLAHSDISERLATALGMRRLGFIEVENPGDDDLDMGEDLLTTIRNRLREYTDSQLLLEFLANALDAGAMEFDVLLDETPDYPGAFLISPNCHHFQNVPALVLHNNSVFTDKDFKGILRTGIGGKADKRNTIGQFGLGALTMFHVTEFAMIVSQDQVLFLNPCQAHLSVGRATLRLPLSTVRRLYSDHLGPIIGLFNFNPPVDTTQEYRYQGTIFWLPTRSTSQFLPEKEPIFRRTTLSLGKIVESFEMLAERCLLFASARSIRCFERKDRQISPTWSFTASRYTPFEDTPSRIQPRVVLQTVTIRGSIRPRPQEWRVLSITVDSEQHPPTVSSLQEQYRLRFPLIVRMATRTGTDQEKQYCLFSTLPLPISIHLPVHISAPLILASDRRSIRLDEHGSDETAYNQWLLSTIIPQLYLHVLADRSSLSDNKMYWPGNGKTDYVMEEYGVISSSIMKGVCKTIPSSNLSVFRSEYTPCPLSPQEARIVYDLPSSVSETIKVLQPPGAVELPLAVCRQLREGRGVQFIDAQYLHQCMVNHHTLLTSQLLEPKRLQSLIHFLLNNSWRPCLDGLRLLPLEDGSYATFGRCSMPLFYVLHPEVFDSGLNKMFHSNRIVRRSLDFKRLVEIEDLNVQVISDSNIGGLLKEHISSSPDPQRVDDATTTWISNFWKIFPLLSIRVSGSTILPSTISPSAISAYPLIPTLTPGFYCSINSCKGSTVIVADFASVEEFLLLSLTRMGFALIDTGSLPQEVRSALDPAFLSADYVLSKLFSRPQSPKKLFDTLDSELRFRFTEWVLSDLGYKDQKYFLEHRNYLQLPLWKSSSGSFISAHDAEMLPSSVPLDPIAPFASAMVIGYSSLLSKMDVTPSHVLSLIRIPDRLGVNMEESYDTLIPILLQHSSHADGIRMPNSQRVMKQTGELYSSSDDLFLAAFGPDSEHMILPSFRKYEDRLQQFGLIQKRDLTFAMFRTCVEAFQTARDSDNNLRDRAATLFLFFAEDLPLRVNLSEEHLWRTLDNLRFIPRNKSAKPLPGINAKRYIDEEILFLPDVVAPNQVVRVEFIPIAWTQRVLFSTEPHQRVRMVYPELGVPTAEEVVKHLEVLAVHVARDHPHNPTLIQHLEKTYRWLNDHAESAAPYLRQLTEKSIRIFLNVNNPRDATETWVWKPAKGIILDTEDTPPLQCPRNFLKPFTALLTAAETVVIKNKGDMTYQPLKDEDRLSNLCTVFDSMRKEGIYTDRNRDRDTDLLLEMLTLANSWSMKELHRALQNRMINLNMIHQFNVYAVLAAVQNAEATELVDYCNWFIEANKTEVKRVWPQSEVKPQNEVSKAAC